MVGWVGVPHVTEFISSTCSGATSDCAADLPPYAHSGPTCSSGPWTDGSTPDLFDLTLPLEQAADADAAMDQRRAIKSLLQL